MIEDLDIAFYRPYDAILDTSRGIPWSRWFVGGSINLAHQCLDRHARSSRRDRAAVIWEGEDGTVRRLSYAELHAETCRLAGAMRRLGIGRGDRVGLFLPMVPEAVVAFLACAKIGAISIPIFSGFGAQAVAARLEDGQAVALITADVSFRRGKAIHLEPVAREAADACPSVRHVIVARSRRGLADEGADPDARHIDWDEIVAAEPAEYPVRAARPGNPDDDHLHVGHDGPAQGGRPRARRVPGQDRAGGGPPGRHARGRRPLLGHRPGLDHGPLGAGRRPGRGGDRRPRRGGPRLPGPRSALVDGRAARGHDPGRLADA